MGRLAFGSLEALSFLRELEDLERLQDELKEREPPAPRTARDRANTHDRFMAIHEHRFKTMFRMTRIAFDELVHLLAPYLRRSTRRGLGGALEPWLMTAVGLRYLAGGSHHDIGFGYELASSTFYVVVDEFIDAIHKCKQLDLDSPFIERSGGKWEWDIERLRVLEREFCDKKGEWIRGIFGAVDGIAVKMSCPHWSQCTHLRGPSVFFNRKGFYAIVCQAVCDARRRFLFVSASSEGRYRLARFSTFISELTRLTRNLPPLLLPPCLSPPWTRLPSVYSCPDSISFEQIALGTRMAAIPPPRPFKLVGDAVYEAEPWMLTRLTRGRNCLLTGRVQLLPVELPHRDRVRLWAALSALGCNVAAAIGRVHRKGDQRHRRMLQAAQLLHRSR